MKYFGKTYFHFHFQESSDTSSSSSASGASMGSLGELIDVDAISDGPAPVIPLSEDDLIFNFD
jgi:hypothetical protein